MKTSVIIIIIYNENSYFSHFIEILHLTLV